MAELTMAELTVERTYGEALWEAAKEAGKEEVILEEGLGILEILKKEPELRSFMNYPGLSAVEKKSVLKNIFEDRICRELMNFLYILVDKRRTVNYEGIIKTYKNLVEKEEGYVYGTVYSVTELSDERLAQIEQKTSELLQTNVRLTNKIDPRLMAGVKVLVEGKIIDISYRKKFEDMAGQLKKH
ncbi:MAG: ATP synthase F1 subunit delta [Firmicutes bacterium]|nr:ATP synthase F1 subunit delta [Bacillota bacterium]